MAALGYALATPARLVAVGNENTWIFHKGDEDWRPPTPSIAISLVGHDSLRIVGCGREFDAAKDLNAVRAATHLTWGSAAIIQEVNSPTNEGETQHLIKLARHCLPRVERKTSTVARASSLPEAGQPREAWLPPLFLFRLAGSLADVGYRLSASTGVHGRASTLFFERGSNASPGPVHFHEGSVGLMALGDNVLRFSRSMENDVGEAVRPAVANELHTVPKEAFRNLWFEFEVAQQVFSNSPSVSASEHVRALRLVCAVLEGLWARGWRCNGAADYSKEKRSVFFFTKMEIATSAQFACIAATGGNKLRLINFPPGTAWNLTQGLRDSFPLKIKEVKEDGLASATTPALKLDGFPFDTEYSKGAAPSRLAVTRLIAEAGVRGWRPIASGDVCGVLIPDPDPNHPPRPADAHVIFFVKEEQDEPMREE